MWRLAQDHKYKNGYEQWSSICLIYLLPTSIASAWRNNEKATKFRVCGEFKDIQISSIQKLELQDMDSSADLLGLVLILTLTGCQEADTNKNRDTVGFIKSNLNELLVLILLCHYKLADQHIYSAHFNELPRLPKVPRLALANFDPIFEGILREERTISTATLVPRSFSELVGSMLRVDEDDQVFFSNFYIIIID